MIYDEADYQHENTGDGHDSLQQKPKRSPFDLNLEARTVTHRATGIVFAFTENSDGSWLGESITKPTTGSADAFARLARMAGEAWHQVLSER